MAEPIQTAVIVPVDEVEGVVRKHRLRFDEAAAWGVPAHVTVVYPFVPPRSVNDGVLDRLATVCAAARPLDFTFRRCGWFGTEVLWLAPDPDAEFRSLTAAVVEEFPEHPPYGGAFDDVVPHLTIGQTRSGTLGQLQDVELDVVAKLPITCHVEHALLIAGAEKPDSWRTVATLPLGSS